MTSRRALTRWGNTFAVWTYRRTGGRLVGPGRGTTIGLLTVPGRATGLPRTVAIGFHSHGAGYVVAGTGSGSPRDPQWFRNLRATTRAEVQIRSMQTVVDVWVADAAERGRLWNDVVLAQAPWRQRYAARAGRVIPVAVLTPRTAAPETPLETGDPRVHSVWIRARPDAVWRVYADPSRIPEWQTGSPSIEDVQGAEGDPYRTYVSRRGRLVARTTVLEADAPRRIVTRTSAPLGLRFDTISRLEAHADGTWLHIEVETSWPRGLRTVGRLVELAMLNSKEAAKELANLKRLVEREARG